MNIIEIEGLTKKFQKKTAVDNLSLTVEQGQSFGLLGPNGAGKSTIINILSGLMKRTSGDIRVFGESLDAAPLTIKKRIGLVPQEIALYNDLSALENVKFFAGLYGLRGAKLEAAAKEALVFVGLADNLNERPKTFSGGMKRRLNIACAIAHSPELIIMDEPTVGIDPQSRNYILESIHKLNRRGSTIIYTSHYMEEVEELCNYIAIVDHGKVIAEGTKEELIQLVTDVKDMRIQINANGNAIDIEALKQIKGVQTVELIGNSEISVTSSTEVNNLNQVLATLIAAEIEIMEVNQQTLNLETVFLNLTGRKLRD